MGVVVLSQYAEPRYGLALLQAGSDGRAYMLKERVGDEGQLVAAIEAVAHGGSFMDARVVEAMIAERGQGGALAAVRADAARAADPRPDRAGQEQRRDRRGAYLSKRAVEKHINSILLKLDLPEAQEVSRRVMATLIYLSATEGSAPAR